MSTANRPAIPGGWSAARRTSLVLLLLLALFSSVVMALYMQDRHQEWRLREEEATHRLDLAFELISRELDRVRSDVLFLAEQAPVREFASGNASLRETLENEFSSFIRHKQLYDQVRLLDLSGNELVRVDVAQGGARVVPDNELQDKRERYYVRESLNLPPGEVFVSEFDLNQEQGVIEQPFNPVIRFVTPVVDMTGRKTGLLVLNYLGRHLLQELAEISLPGTTLLLRPDGHYLLSPRPRDQWGWLLGHQRTFAAMVPESWLHVQQADGNCQLTAAGVFASRRLAFGAFSGQDRAAGPAGTLRPEILIVSWLPAEQVFAVSHQLLRRLLLSAALLMIPLFFLTRYWAAASARAHSRISVFMNRKNGYATFPRGWCESRKRNAAPFPGKFTTNWGNR